MSASDSIDPPSTTAPSLGVIDTKAFDSGEARVVGGRFRLVGIVGQGGMSIVYEVVHEITQHRRALKVLRAKPTPTEEAVKRFLREASAAGRIKDPRIIETLDAGVLETGETYVLMELLEGSTLFEYLTATSATITILLELIVEVCGALQAAHEAGIIHRDVKPSNIFVITRDGKPFIKVLDFGISKFDPTLTEETEVTRGDELLGTPSYISPEQIRGLSDCDGRVDVYALGIALYAGIAGTRPFVAKSFGQLAFAIDAGSYKPLDEVRPDLPKSLVAIVHRAMARDRDKRFPTPKALAEAIRGFLDAPRADGSSGALTARLPASSGRPTAQTVTRTLESPEQLKPGAVPAIILPAMSTSLLVSPYPSLTPSPAPSFAPPAATPSVANDAPTSSGAPAALASEAIASARPSRKPPFIAGCAVLAVVGIVAGGAALRSRTSTVRPVAAPSATTLPASAEDPSAAAAAGSSPAAPLVASAGATSDLGAPAPPPSAPSPSLAVKQTTGSPPPPRGPSPAPTGELRRHNPYR